MVYWNTIPNVISVFVVDILIWYVYDIFRVYMDIYVCIYMRPDSIYIIYGLYGGTTMAYI